MTSVSILIPAFNCAEILPRCIASLENQTVTPNEIIVVDDGSSDDTANVAGKLNGVRVIRRETQGGAGAARATGGIHAHSEIIAFLDSDCIAPSDWLEKITREFNKDKELVAVGGMYRHCDVNSHVAMFQKFEEEYLHWFLAETPYDSILSGGNMAVRRKVWENCRTGRELMYFGQVASSEDTVVVNEIRGNGKTLFNPDIFVEHLPSHNFRSFCKRNLTRARTRILSKLHSLNSVDDNIFRGFGGFNLVFSALSLWMVLFLIVAYIFFLAPPLWIAAGAALGLASHLFFSRNYFQFIRSNYKRPCSVPIRLIDEIGMRLLLIIRLACWAIGALRGVGQYIVDRFKFYFEICASVLHFWNPRRISKMFYFVTSKCNARCEFCFNLENVVNWKSRQETELTLEEVEKITNKLGRLPYLTFSGGEPFARTDLASVAQMFYKNCKTRWITVPTNGALTKRTLNGVIDILSTCPNVFLTIQFSIDSLNEAHDESRKIKGGFQSMLKTADKLSALRRQYKNLRIQINTPYDVFNLKDIEGIRDYCRTNIDFDQHFFYMFRTEGELISADTADLTDQFTEFVQSNDDEERASKHHDLWGRAVRALQSVTYSDFRKIKKKHQFIRPCYAVKKFITLYDDGQLTPCEVLSHEELANIRDYDYDFYQLKHSVKLAEYHKEKVVDAKCNCEWLCALPLNMLYDPNAWLRIARAFFQPVRVNR